MHRQCGGLTVCGSPLKDSEAGGVFQSVLMRFSCLTVSIAYETDGDGMAPVVSKLGLGKTLTHDPWAGSSRAAGNSQTDVCSEGTVGIIVGRDPRAERGLVLGIAGSWWRD